MPLRFRPAPPRREMSPRPPSPPRTSACFWLGPRRARHPSSEHVPGHEERFRPQALPRLRGPGGTTLLGAAGVRAAPELRRSNRRPSSPRPPVREPPAPQAPQAPYRPPRPRSRRRRSPPAGSSGIGPSRLCACAVAAGWETPRPTSLRRRWCSRPRPACLRPSMCGLSLALRPGSRHGAAGRRRSGDPEAPRSRPGRWRERALPPATGGRALVPCFVCGASASPGPTPLLFRRSPPRRDDPRAP